MIGWLYLAMDRLRQRRYAENHGRIGEDLAHRYLRSHGCTVVARNYRTLSGSGEIDLVVWDGVRLAFIEVKTRSATEFGPPEGAVDAEKRERLRIAAREYARHADVPWPKTRFDIGSISLEGKPRIEWLRDAFWARVHREFGIGVGKSRG